MSILESLPPTQPGVEQGAMRVKRTLTQVFQQVEVALEQVRQVTQRYGSDKIQPALGSDGAEVTKLYTSLKTLIEQHKPGTIVPDLPK